MKLFYTEKDTTIEVAEVKDVVEALEQIMAHKKRLFIFKATPYRLKNGEFIDASGKSTGYSLK